MTETTPEQHARQLHEQLLVIDGHADSFSDIPVGRLRDYLADNGDHELPGHVDLPRQRAGGIDLSLQAVYTPGEHRGDAALAYCTDFAARVHATVRRAAGQLHLIRELPELDALAAAAPGDRVPSILLHLEGVTPLAGKLERLEALDAMGFRSVGLTHNFANEAAGGCTSADLGLTDFGRALIGELDARGWLLDVAHLGPRSLDDLLATGARPLVTTHTGMGALCDSPRALSDEQARALADTGGVVAIDFVPEHLVPGWDEGPVTADREDAFRHLHHAVELLGDQHVAIGSDFDGYTTPLGGMTDARDYPWLTLRMLEEGYDQARIARILGGNLLRVLRERLAARDRSPS